MKRIILLLTALCVVYAPASYATKVKVKGLVKKTMVADEGRCHGHRQRVRPVARHCRWRLTVRVFRDPALHGKTALLRHAHVGTLRTEAWLWLTFG